MSVFPRRTHYPEEWFDGNTRTIVRGKDWNEIRCTDNMVDGLRSQAIKRGKKVQVQVHRIDGEITFKCIPAVS